MTREPAVGVTPKLWPRSLRTDRHARNWRATTCIWPTRQPEQPGLKFKSGARVGHGPLQFPDIADVRQW